ncbi:ligase-associated DNA damage response DEXH box helicase [Elioraea tepidiphila]|uniref:ligase-associated DNA damage response DEXH box helicase n=1 Tax=Elioraea tepidiphila TaxID=457934 RepID=UPI002FDA42B7
MHETGTPSLPAPLAAWFAARSWRPHPHQLAMLAEARAGRSALLIAPTGAGKTLAGFLPTLAALAEAPREGLHTLYVSPLKALATDIARNLTRPVTEMGLPIAIETRTGDTDAATRRRQRETPPQILLTTPESLAVMLSMEDADRTFAGLSTIVVDEIHALAGTKRGDQLALCLSRLATLAPGARRVGLSATVPHRAPLVAFLSADGRGTGVAIVEAPEGAAPEIAVRLPDGALPWSGHMGLLAAPAIYNMIREARTAIVFVNTRAQAELVFQALWRLNDDALPIALHHGSLAREQRAKVEAAMAEGRLKAVVATSSLDLGIDWGDVDLVIQVGAPKGVARLMQRIGRANHRWDEPSRAILVPANRFEVLECRCAIAGVAARDLDGDPPPPGGLDVLAQHILGVVCAGPIHPDDLYAEVTRAAPYADLPRRDFDDVVRFVEDGGYALAAYDRYRKLFCDAEDRLHVANARVARQHRMNVGTIVEAPLLKVKLGRGFGGHVLGEIEEYFVSMLQPGDTFMFAGRLLRFDRLHETMVECSPGMGDDPKVPAYAGGRLPLTTYLADRVRAMLQDPAQWHDLPEDVAEWLRLQKARSRLPGRNDLLVETFPRGGRWFLVAYCFEGRNAHQTLGMLLTRRMERAGFGPLGFVATDYVVAVWSAHQPVRVAELFGEDMLGDDLEEWMAESSMLRRTFRNVAVIAGLVDRHHPGAEKSRRQVTVNTDLIYDVLRKHEPDHVLLRATRADAARGLVDVGRVAALLKRAQGRVVHMALSRVSPLAVPVLLEVGKESVAGAGEDALLAEAEEAALVAEALGEAEPAPPPVHPVHRANAARHRKRPSGYAVGTQGRTTLRTLRGRRQGELPLAE